MDLSMANPHVTMSAFGLAAIVIALIPLYIGQKQHNRHVASAGGVVMGVGVLALTLGNLAIFFNIGIPGLGPQVIGSAVTAPVNIQLTQSQLQANEVCSIGQVQVNPTITLKNKYTGASFTTAGLWRTILDRKGNPNKGAWNAFTSGTQIGTDITPGSTIEVILGNGTSAQFGQHATIELPCESNPTYNIEGVTSENAAGLTLTFLDSRGANAAEVPVADSQSKFYIEAKAADNEVYGNPFGKDSAGNDIKYPNEMLVTLPSANWTTIDGASIEEAPAGCGCEGLDLTATSTNRYAQQNLLGSGNISAAFAIPAMDDNQRYVFEIKATASSTAADADSGRIWFFAGNYFIYDNAAPSGLANEIGFGIVNRLVALVGLSQANTDSIQGNFA